MKKISCQGLKSSLLRLLNGKTEPENETVLAPPPAIIPLNLSEEKIEDLAQKGVALPFPQPWLRDWSRSAPDEVFTFHRDVWTARSTGVETPQLALWDKKFTSLAAQFFSNPENRKNIVVADFPFEEKGLYYKDANDTHHRLPTALQGSDLATVIIPRSSSGAVLPAPSSSGP